MITLTIELPEDATEAADYSGRLQAIATAVADTFPEANLTITDSEKEEEDENDEDGSALTKDDEAEPF